MVPAGASSGFADPEGVESAVGAPKRTTENGLLTALDRLSVSLDRIQALLAELHSGSDEGELSTKRVVAEPSPRVSRAEPSAADARAEPSARETRAEPSAADTRAEPSPGGPQAGEAVAGQLNPPRVIYGGGPSAFVSREPANSRRFSSR